MIVVLRNYRGKEKPLADFHWQIINYITLHFKNIIIPKFETSRMTNNTRNNRVIRASTARTMLDMAHYRFRQRLLYKAGLRGNRVFVVDEDYTTKTCGRCGELNEVGSSEIYKCSHCRITLGRDYNAARNIYIKFLVEHC